MTTAYPLAWPEGWPRTPETDRKRGYEFKQRDYMTGHRRLVTFAKARDGLYEELRLLGAGDVVMSSNFPRDKYGVPIEGKRQPNDLGVAVYFTLRDRSMVMACDRFDNAAANMRSLALAIDAMRQLERHGGGTMMERAFQGFAALPGPGVETPWWSVLQVPQGASKGEIERAYRTLAAQRHPDRGGSHRQMAELNRARDDALRQTGA